MRVPVDASRGKPPDACGAEHDEERAAEHLAATLDNDWQRPPERDDRPGAKREQQRVSRCKANCDAERARPLNGGGFPRRAERQRRNRHQMVRAKPVEKAEDERGGNQEHVEFYCMGEDFSSILHEIGSVFGK